MGRTMIGKRKPRKVLLPMDLVRDRKYKRSGPVICYQIPVERVTDVETTPTWADVKALPFDERKAFFERHRDLSDKDLADLVGAPPPWAISNQRLRCGVMKRNPTKTKIAGEAEETTSEPPPVPKMPRYVFEMHKGSMTNTELLQYLRGLENLLAATATLNVERYFTFRIQIREYDGNADSGD